MVPFARVLTAFSLADRIITVTAGEDSVGLHVHEGVLRSRSPFFEAALSRNWREGNQGHVDFPEDPAHIVKLYLQYLYTGKMDMRWTASMKEVPENMLLPEHVTLARLYVFGEKVGDIAFKHDVIRAVLGRIEKRIEGHGFYPVGEAVDIIYKGTTCQSKMRQLVVDVTVSTGNDQWIDPALHQNNAEFMVDLARAFMLSREAKSAIIDELRDGRYQESR